jgi:quercetin dioxygenase-like cupin family protein
MASVDQRLTNFSTGDTYLFLETAESSDGKCVSIRTTLFSEGPIVPKHVHVLQTESFEIISGALTIWADGKEFEIGPGESITFPVNTPHNHYNNYDEPAIYIHTVTPALDFEHLVEGLVGLASDGKALGGNYGLIQELVSLKYLDSKAFLADIPIGIQKVMMNTIAPIARLFGYRAVYPKYSGFEK